MFVNKPSHFRRAVEGVGFSRLSLITLGIRGFSLQVFVQSSLFGGNQPNLVKDITKKKKFHVLVIRVQYDGRRYESRYAVQIRPNVEVFANFISSMFVKGFAKMKDFILRPAKIQATLEEGIIQKPVVKASSEIQISAKLKD